MSAPNALPCPVYVRYFLQYLKGKTIGDHSWSLTHIYKEKSAKIKKRTITFNCSKAF